MGQDALRRGATEAEKGKDADMHREFVALFKETRPQERFDDSVADRIEAVVERETDRLENDLKGYKNNLIKESIRVSPVDQQQDRPV